MGLFRSYARFKTGQQIFRLVSRAVRGRRAQPVARGRRGRAVARGRRLRV
jgi:hypothetical protein